MTENQSLILIVDDDADIRLLLNIGLRKAGFATLQASNGIKALEMLKDRTPDLIVTDAMMPLLDGYGLIRAVKIQPDIKHIPIILLTGNVDEGGAEGDIPPDERIKKPFATADLIAKIEKLLSKA